MADPTMDIFSALNGLFTGLRQNMSQQEDKDLKALAILGKLPGMEVAQAPNAQAAPWWQHLLGMPAFRAGAGGAPVARIGQTPLTVRKEPSAFEALESLYGTTGTSNPALIDSPLTQGPIPETNNLATPGATTTLPARTLTARQRYATTLAQQYGLAPDDLLNDVTFQAEFSKPGSKVSDMRKYAAERAKTLREMRTGATDQYTKQLDIIARELLQVRDTPSLHAATARLTRLGIPPELLQELPQSYEPTQVQAWINRAIPPTTATAGQREAENIQLKSPYEIQAAADKERALAPIRTQEAVNRERALGGPRLQNKLAEREALIPLENQQSYEQLVGEAPIRSRINAATGADAARINSQARTLGAVSQKRLEALDEEAIGAQKTAETLDEINALIARGVYTTGAEDLLRMEGYKTGLLFQRDPQAARTAHLYELGSRLTAAKGLGGQVSDADRQEYAKAAGNFQRAKNAIEMQESIATMSRIARKALINANVARRMYAETGTLPDFGLSGTVPAAQGQQRMPMTAEEIDLNMLEANKQRRARGQPEATREQIIDGLRKLGYEVP